MKFVLSAYNKRKQEFVTVDSVDEAESVTLFGVESANDKHHSRLLELGFINQSCGTTKKGEPYVRYSKYAPRNLDVLLGL